ncbi:MAG: tRNA (guanosine(46)-N7)-methyltransferase TrmB, partial [Planctomycetes bacterium]|nr:tRNA (guanosine(46)-N7)-methyltransferase TrmB [Planctomycetota bacterium]
MSKMTVKPFYQQPLESILLNEDLVARQQPINFATLFSNPRPVEIEIGSGKGTFLLYRAKARSDLNFLGLEWARHYSQYSADRMFRWGLQNVRILRADAAAFLHCCVSDNSLHRVHIYFPDPWPKTRHLKRRLIRSAFIALVHKKLRVGG